ncbi:MAG TPA: FKBP-type peptidyl-prolyl cis-trans isomerase [Chitinophaga sp.]|nr:FKBP-type peptidyl-prolyl cis-trans isomerase [Chitinophaga sp.]
MKVFLPVIYNCLLSVLLFSACSKNEYDGSLSLDGAIRIIEEQDKDITAYIEAHNLTMVKDPSGMYYHIENLGDSTSFMTLNSVPTIIFTRSNLADSVLDASFGDTNFDGRQLKDHIVGWQIGLRKVGKGGRLQMIIPSPLAFGTTGVSNIIPPNTVLVCDVTVVDFK